MSEKEHDTQQSENNETQSLPNQDATQETVDIFDNEVNSSFVLGYN